ncbi:hypothetical protein PFISCL1PPCAC_13043, partial [Pristionchus fissidentatus]
GGGGRRHFCSSCSRVDGLHGFEGGRLLQLQHVATHARLVAHGRAGAAAVRVFLSRGRIGSDGRDDDVSGRRRRVHAVGLRLCRSCRRLTGSSRLLLLQLNRLISLHRTSLLIGRSGCGGRRCVSHLHRCFSLISHSHCRRLCSHFSSRVSSLSLL